MEQSDLEKELEQEIWGLRLLVLNECTCPAREEKHFHQVLLDQEQFKKVSDACFHIQKREGDHEEGYVTLGQTALSLEPFEGMTDIDHE